MRKSFRIRTRSFLRIFFFAVIVFLLSFPIYADGGRIALSFDDGPHPVYTPRLLDLLSSYGIKATFFTVGENVVQYPEIVCRELREGHEVGNHTFSHPCLKKLSAEKLIFEIDRCEETLYETADYRPYLFRPPEGFCSDAIRKEAEELGYRIVLWDVDTLDWSSKTSQKHVVDTILSEVSDGDIILCHDYVARDKSVTVDALSEVIPALIGRGFEFVRVSELE